LNKKGSGKKDREKEVAAPKFQKGGCSQVEHRLMEKRQTKKKRGMIEGKRLKGLSER